MTLTLVEIRHNKLSSYLFSQYSYLLTCLS